MRSFLFHRTAFCKGEGARDLVLLLCNPVTCVPICMWARFPPVAAVDCSAPLVQESLSCFRRVQIVAEAASASELIVSISKSGGSGIVVSQIKQFVA